MASSSTTNRKQVGPPRPKGSLGARRLRSGRRQQRRRVQQRPRPLRRSSSPPPGATAGSWRGPDRLQVRWPTKGSCGAVNQRVSRPGVSGSASARPRISTSSSTASLKSFQPERSSFSSHVVLTDRRGCRSNARTWSRQTGLASCAERAAVTELRGRARSREAPPRRKPVSTRPGRVLFARSRWRQPPRHPPTRSLRPFP